MWSGDWRKQDNFYPWAVIQGELGYFGGEITAKQNLISLLWTNALDGIRVVNPSALYLPEFLRRPKWIVQKIVISPNLTFYIFPEPICDPNPTVEMRLQR